MKVAPKREVTIALLMRQPKSQRVKDMGLMDTIPELSPNVTHLIISHGKFSNVTRNTFLNLTQDSIKVLKMTSCGIKFIAKDAFKNFTKMERPKIMKD